MMSIELSNKTERVSTLMISLLEQGVVVSVKVTGDSMYPLWKHKRDTLILEKCYGEELRKGDIALYRRETGKLVIHRIINVNKDSYDLCGDAQTQIEYKLPKENVIAVVKSFTRKGKNYSCRDLVYRIYAYAWMHLLPFRGLLLKLVK